MGLGCVFPGAAAARQFVSAGSSGPVTLAQDDFSDANGTNLSGKALDAGGTWVVNAGTWRTQSGKAEKTANNNIHETSHTECSNATATVQSDFTSGTSGGIVARLTDNDNHWALEHDGFGGTFNLYEKNGGTYTTRATTSGLASGTHTLKLVCSGTVLTGTADGASQISYGSATFNQTATKYGLWLYATTEKHDNFLVTTP